MRTNEGTRLEDWFRRGLAIAPDAAALVTQGRTWTFDDIDALAKSWAAAIIARLTAHQGALVVAVLGGRDVVSYAGALAVWYAGATLIPLNTAFPPDRTVSMISNAGADVVLADSANVLPLVERLEGTGTEVVLVDPSGPLDVAAERPTEPGGECAYVMFTSGSTGTPKGVPISHGNVSAFLTSVIGRYSMTPADRLVQSYDMTFDLGVASLLMAWAQGCAIVPASPLALANPSRLVERHGITVWASVPSVIDLAQSAGTLQPGSLGGLRLSMFCGEPLTQDAAQVWHAAAPNSRVENTYGPTEVTMFCTAQTWEGRDPSHATVPIGEPFEGTRVRVVDAEGMDSLEGELWLAGAQVFGGYLDPSQDADAFVSKDADQKTWYRTGDVVRWKAGGLVHLGRLDDQLQVGGFRVEPGEVEACIRRELSVTTAVVVKRGTGLVAFVHPGSTDSDPLQRLAETLPSHLLPERIIVVADVVRNANGKISRSYYTKLAQEDPS